MTLSEKIKAIAEREPEVEDVWKSMSDRCAISGAEMEVDYVIECVSRSDYDRLKALALLSAELVEAASQHKWHEDGCEYRQKLYLNNEKLCDCGAFAIRQALNKTEKLLEELGAEGD